MKQSYKVYNKRKDDLHNFFLFISSLIRAAFLLLISVLMLGACDRDEVFEKEQYKNVFALISENDNVIRAFHSLGDESIGVVSASLGGTNPTEKDIVINMVEDPSLIDVYNLTNFDVDKNKYVRPLPKDNYDIESFQFKILAGEIKGNLPIHIRSDGLSTDSAYFIPLRIESHTAYEANPEKSFVLYQVRIKNWWAVSDGSTMYNMVAKQSEVGQTYELQLLGTKVMYPLSKNQVRVMVGNEKFEKEISIINESAITLTIDDDNKVAISPYKNVEVSQIDGDKFYSNSFFIEDDGFQTYKTFRLYYQYNKNGKTYIIKEELRLQFNEEEEEMDNETSI